MPSFHFQLDGVLRHRKHVEEERQRELAVRQQHFQSLRTELTDLDRMLQDATADLRRDHLVGAIDLSYLAAHRRFVAATQRKAVALAQKMALAQRQIDEARAALAEAAKQRKVIDKLRERQYARWMADFNRREMIEMDEIGTQLAHRHLAEAAGDAAGGES